MLSNVINYTYHSSRRIDFQVVLPLEVGFALAQKIILEVIKNKDHALKKPVPMILASIKGGHMPMHQQMQEEMPPEAEMKSS